MEELFSSAVRSSEDLAGVFEYDGETGYFYLYEMPRRDDQRVVDSIHIASGAVDFSDDDIVVAWDETEDRVGLFIRETLWAVFNVLTNAKHGGDYRPGRKSEVPKSEAFSLIKRIN